MHTSTQRLPVAGDGLATRPAPPASKSTLSSALSHTPFPNGWVCWNGMDPDFEAAGPGFPLEEYFSTREAGVRYPLCLIDAGDPATEGFDQACKLRRLDPKLVIVVGVPAGGLHGPDVDLAAAARLLLVERSGGRECLEHNIRVLLSGPARHRARYGGRLRRCLGRLSTAMDNLASIKGVADMKANFLSMASHELRTPLANIALGAGLIRTHADSLAPDERSNILNGIATGVDHMTKLLDDLLISARLQQFHLSIRPEKLNLAELVDVAISSLAADLRSRVVWKLEVDSPNLLADRSLLELILVNLLSNACKYSPGGQPVELEIGGTNQELTIHVLDRGIGIPPDQVARVFDGFFRGNNIGQIGGTGLGLFIVRQCVSLLGGEVECANRSGGGAVFSVRIGALAEADRMGEMKTECADPFAKQGEMDGSLL